MQPHSVTPEIPADGFPALPVGGKNEEDHASKQFQAFGQPHSHQSAPPGRRTVGKALMQTSIALLRDILLPLLLLLVGFVALTYGERHWKWLHDHPVTWAVVLLGVAEALFWVYARIKVVQVQKTSEFTVTTPQQRMQLFQRCLASVEDDQYEAYFSQWFRNTPFSEIRRENVEQWFAWVLFDERWRHLTESEREELNYYVRTVEARLPQPFPDGYNPKIRAMRLRLDPVEVHHHPLVFYLVLAILRLAHNIAMVAQGFQRNTSGPIAYWYRPAKNTSKLDTQLDPVVFAHGLGIGLSQYCLFIAKLSSLDSAVFLIEINNIASSLVEEAVAMEDALPALQSMLNDHGYERAVWMGHSYGSVYVSWILRNNPELATKAVLLDPIVILLNLPAVCFNFVYRKPASTVEFGLQYYAARELFISKSMSRNFHWQQCILWSEDINVPTLIVLSESDAITNTTAIRKYIEKAKNPNVHTIWLHGCGHAQFLFVPSLLGRIFERIKIHLLTETTANSI